MNSISIARYDMIDMHEFSLSLSLSDALYLNFKPIQHAHKLKLNAFARANVKKHVQSNSNEKPYQNCKSNPAIQQQRDERRHYTRPPSRGRFGEREREESEVSLSSRRVGGARARARCICPYITHAGPRALVQ